MPIVVQKYGGSSVADVAKIAAVAEKVVATKRRGNDVVVVLSAMGKTTDALLALARQAAAEGLPEATEPPRRELDMLVSTGERVSIALLSIAIEARGERAISFTGSQSGIITTDRHFDARILEVRPHRIEEELARGKIVIVAGYQGMSRGREITTLGRGGSDTTAVALAAALGAERCEIYSDVDGIYSADPRVVPSPQHLPEIELGTLQEMAEAGAKVINAQAVEWARRSNITIVARKTADPVSPDSQVARETLARQGARACAVRAVVGLDGIVEARLSCAGLAAFAACAATLELGLMEVSVAGDRAACVLALHNVPDWEQRRAQLQAALGGALQFEGGKARVSVVGEGLSQAAALARFLRALEEAGALPSAVVANALRLSANVERSRLDEAQRALHAAFVA